MFIKQLFGKPNHWMIKNLICNSIFIDVSVKRGTG